MERFCVLCSYCTKCFLDHQLNGKLVWPNFLPNQTTPLNIHHSSSTNQTQNAVLLTAHQAAQNIRCLTSCFAITWFRSLLPSTPASPLHSKSAHPPTNRLIAKLAREKPIDYYYYWPSGRHQLRHIHTAAEPPTSQSNSKPAPSFLEGNAFHKMHKTTSPIPTQSLYVSFKFATLDSFYFVKSVRWGFCLHNTFAIIHHTKLMRTYTTCL